MLAPFSRLLRFQAAGYTVLAVGSCASIQSPTIRAAIRAYVVQRGLSIVFAPHGAEQQTARSLAHALYTADADATATQYMRGRPGAPGALYPARNGSGSSSAETCLAEALSAHSGPGGWNDPATLLPAPEAVRELAAGRLPAWRLLAQLRTAFSRRCVLGEALMLAPGLALLRERDQPLHAQALRILGDELALAVHRHVTTPAAGVRAVARVQRHASQAVRLPPSAFSNASEQQAAVRLGCLCFVASDACMCYAASDASW